ncbi:sensor histidine kinase [Thetidibacter halocola]|uniref:GAF domain-containing protein n=1 Tax=Thetidibacter halocola TaxID=2827239 RepID=A0A8J8B6V5_9RHOB|nr:histidine kinase dimerization/phosphoacceptor domain -containing protein [Thetidibacter halocola]MBS0122940.1 GAF domain-containing protein [Thetidibacter halocola]
MQADKPRDEAARLRALRDYDILDSGAETGFDEVVALVSRLLDVPVALVSLVDAERQWFKARVGLDRAETPLDQSICAHAILGTELLEIPDTTRDRRTIDNPLCCGGLVDLRFYAGVPLIAPGGQALGTLCVLDTRPRVLTDLQRNTLRVMAAQVMRQLDLRRALRAEAVLRDEIDHRVKNSLQTVASLVRLYRARAQGDEAREVLDAVARRIGAVADLHGALYRAGTPGSVPLDDYLGRVVALLTRQAPEGVRVEAVLAPLVASPEAAQALAVIVSEFAANAFKHAFGAGQAGAVRVSLRDEDGALLLEAHDTGGSAAPEAGDTGGGIGLRLMQAAADQLGGSLTIGPGPEGYRLELIVPARPVA